ncbi:hypothetical protein JQ616_07565 [Bradyrhizobium tropiciagri]|uniref:hypothetical protein n=1 Tax=Bradyrhizobium tropiciagri TaxID=312253 RepID=UPI001BACBE48|nr:hypothetical protein [Bradyrhizobium tropiciagri]MBR0894802.1 hypothetical protein [Bradyrhizobium tropiciagri]
MIFLALIFLFGWSADRSPNRLAEAVYITELSRSNAACPRAPTSRVQRIEAARDVTNSFRSANNPTATIGSDDRERPEQTARDNADRATRISNARHGR